MSRFTTSAMCTSLPTLTAAGCLSHLGVLGYVVESRDVQAKLARLGELAEARTQGKQRVAADACGLPH